MPSPRDDDVKRAALEATVKVIASGGVGSLSMRGVARSIGASTGALSYHFGSKRGMLLEAISYGYWRVPTWFGQRPALESMRYVLSQYELSTPKRRQWWQFWLAVTSHAQGDAKIHRVLLTEYRSIEERWAVAIGRGQSEGTFDVAVDPLSAAQRLAFAAHGIALGQLNGAIPVSESSLLLAREFEPICVPEYRSGVD